MAREGVRWENYRAKWESSVSHLIAPNNNESNTCLQIRQNKQDLQTWVRAIVIAERWLVCYVLTNIGTRNTMKLSLTHGSVSDLHVNGGLL